MEVRVVVRLRNRQRIAGVVPYWREARFPIRRAGYRHADDVRRMTAEVAESLALEIEIQTPLGEELGQHGVGIRRAAVGRLAVGGPPDGDLRELRRRALRLRLDVVRLYVRG